MTTLRFSVLVGLVIGAVWAFAGISGALVTVVVVAASAVIGALVSHGAIDVGAIIGRRDDD